MDIVEAVRKALGAHGDAIRAFHEKNMAELTGLKAKITELEKKGAPTEEIADLKASLGARVLEIEQKVFRGRILPNPGGDASSESIAELLINSEAIAAFKNGHSTKVSVEIPPMMFKAAIMNSSGTAQPLVAPDRQPGIVVAPQRRFTVRDILGSVPTSSNLVEFTRETVLTNNAGPQGAGSSPAETEGQPLLESGMNFELANTPVITVGTWIPASRQVLDDSASLSQHINSRLLYMLKLEEERELLGGTGTAGELSGLVTNATAFSGGATNQTALDTLAVSIAQLAASEYEPTGFILNPSDWFSSKFLLAKDAQNRYLLGDPGAMREPRLWGLPVAVTNAMTRGKFMTLDAPRAGYIADREAATIRVSESHLDWFIRGMVAIVIEERLALVVEQAGALIYGDLSYAG